MDLQVFVGVVSVTSGGVTGQPPSEIGRAEAVKLNSCLLVVYADASARFDNQRSSVHTAHNAWL
jgi:hypothetical protein